jgi:hypothetical protein
MTKERPTLVKETALQAGWSEPGARWMALRVTEPTAAAQIVTAAAAVPEAVRAVILRDMRHTSDAALVAAFREADEINKVLNLCAQGAPMALRQIGNYVHRDADGEHLMSAAEAREKLTNALAEMDVHIDTTRPVSAVERGVAGSIAQASDAYWSAQKAKEAAK